MSSFRAISVVTAVLLLCAGVALAAPGQPTLTLSDPPNDNGTQVQLTIGRSSDDGIGADNVTQYTVYHKNGYLGTYTVMTTIPATNATTYYYLATGLAYNVNHWFQVSATDSGGGESTRAQGYLNPQDETAPGKPTLTLTDPPSDNGTQVQLTIGRSPDDGIGADDVQKYTVYYKAGYLGTWGPIATITATNSATYSYLATGLARNTNNWFGVTATDVAGHESARAQDYLNPKDEAAPGKPTLALSDPPGDNGTQVQLTIGRSPDDGIGADDVQKYTVYYKAGYQGTWAPIQTIPATDSTTYSYLATGLAGDTNNWFGVTATDGTGNESLRAQAYLNPRDETAPGKPTLTLSDPPNDNGTQVQLTIGRSPDDGIGADDVQKYTVYYKAGYQGTWAPIATIPATNSATYTYLATGLAYNVNHWFGVTASDAAGNESLRAQAYLNPVDETTPGPPTLTLTDPPNDNGTQVQLNIGRSPDDGIGADDVQKYTVYYKAGYQGTWARIATIAATNAETYTYLATGLAFNVNNWFGVTATDTAGHESTRAQAYLNPKDEAAPGKPTLVLSDPPNDNGTQVQLTIGRSPDDGIGADDVQKYTVYYKAGYNGTWAPLATIPATNAATYAYLATGLAFNVNHWFGVTATDVSGNESLRAQAYLNPKDEAAPSPPTLTLADVPNDNGTQVQLNIGRSPDDGSGADDVQKYTVYYKAGYQGTWAPIATIPATDSTTYAYLATGLAYNVNNWFGVTATDVSGNESVRAQAYLNPKDETAPGPPTLTLTDPPNDNGTQVQLNIGRSPDDGIGADDVRKYTVYYKAGYQGTWAPVATIPATNAATYTYLATGLAYNVNHWFGVTATDTAGNVSTRAQAYLNPKDETAPGPPTLTLTDPPNDNGTQVQLNIGRSPDDGIGADDVQKYTVYYKAGYDGTWAPIATIPATNAETYSYLATGLTFNVNNWFGVTATDTAGNASTRAQAYLNPKDELAPGKPGLTLTDPPTDDGDTLQLNIARSADDGAGAKDVVVYRVYHKVGTGAYSLLTTVPATGAASYVYVATGLTRGALHGFGVSARDRSGNESAKAEASTTPADTTPAQPPANLAVTDVPSDDGTALDVSFTASPDDTANDSEVTSYRVFRATSATGTATQVGTVPAIHLTVYSYRDSGLTAGTTYWYYVTAVASTGNASTARVSGTPKDDRPVLAPSALTAADHPYDTGKVIDLTWTRSGDDGIGRKHVTKYNVYRCMANVAQAPALVGTVTATGAATYAWSDTTVPMDLILYEYRLTAATSGGAESTPAGPAQAASENNNVVVFQPPTNLTAADVAGDSGGQILLTWYRSVSEGDIGPPPPPPVLSTVTPQGGYGGTYEFYRRVSGGSYPSTPAFSVSAAGTNDPMTYIDSGLTNGTRYYYRVRYRRYNQISEFTSEASAVPAINTSSASASVGAAAGDEGTASEVAPAAEGLSVRLDNAPGTVAVGQDLLLTTAVGGNTGAASVYVQYSINGAALACTAAVTGQDDFTAPIKVKTSHLSPGATVYVRAVVVTTTQTAVSTVATVTTATP